MRGQERTIEWAWGLDPTWDTPSPGALMPSRAHTDDAGWDLVVAQRVTIDPNQFVDVPNGIRVALPADCWGLLTGRSSTLRRLGLMVAQGVIDPGYRGELYTGVWNLRSKPVTLEVGQRVSQLIVIQNATETTKLRYVEQLEVHAGGRNEGGFGSSGA